MADSTPLGQLAAQMMEMIDREFGPEAALGEFAIVVEIREAQQGVTNVRVGGSDARGWIQSGLLTEGIEAVREAVRMPPED